MATFVHWSAKAQNDNTLARDSDQLKQAPQEPDEQQLLNLARELAEVFIAGDTCNPWLAQHIAFDFKGTHDLSTTSMTATEYIKLIKQIRRAHGDRRFEIMDEQVDFEDTDKTTAMVWQTVRYVIDDEPLERSASRISRWRRGLDDERRWMCYEHAGLKNDALVSGMIVPCFRR